MITGIGIIILPLCAYYSRSLTSLLSLVFICSAFMAAAVLVFGGFGVSPGLLPTAIFLGIFVMRTIFGKRYPAERLALQVLLPFILVVAWALVSSLLMPRLFAGEILVWPQKLSGFLVISPLEPNAGNITQDCYLSAAAALAICASIYLTETGLNLHRLFNAYLAAGMLVVFIALWQFVSNIVGIWFPAKFFLSNPGWAILTDQSIGSLIRLTGPCSEPSQLAGYLCGITGAAGWVVLNGHPGRWPKIVFGSALGVVLLSTSTTGYVALAMMSLMAGGYSLLLGAPLLRKNLIFLFGGIFALAATAVAVVPVVAPGIAKTAATVIEGTMNKQQSSSYRDRTSADRDSVHAMESSYGFGVGWGSNRSSSLIPGLLASVGVVGLAGLAWFILSLIFHVRAAQRLMPAPELRLIMHGCAGGLIGTLASAVISGPSITSSDFYLLVALLVATAARVRHNARVATTQPASVQLRTARRSTDIPGQIPGQTPALAYPGRLA